MTNYDFYDVINPVGDVIDTLCLSEKQAFTWKRLFKSFTLVPTERLTPEQKQELIAILGDMEK